MATYNWGVDKTYRAESDMVNDTYKFVVSATTAGYIKLAAAEGINAIGVIQNNPRAGEECTVRVVGFTKIVGNGNNVAITAGSFISCASDGMVYPACSATGSGYVLGRAEETLSTGSNVPIMCFLYPGPFRLTQYKGA
jgi:hypothetical protein